MIEIPPGFIEFKLDEQTFRADVLEHIQFLDGVSRNYAATSTNDLALALEHLHSQYRTHLCSLWATDVPFHAVWSIRNAVEYAYTEYKKKLEASFAQHFGVPTSSSPSPTTNVLQTSS